VHRRSENVNLYEEEEKTSKREELKNKRGTDEYESWFLNYNPGATKRNGRRRQNPAGSDEPETAGEEKGNYKKNFKKNYTRKK
jgi:hypothetical protein